MDNFLHGGNGLLLFSKVLFYFIKDFFSSIKALQCFGDGKLHIGNNSRCSGGEKFQIDNDPHHFVENIILFSNGY